jgi:hypothetical protein
VGKKSRQKMIRRALRPLIEAAVRKSRDDMGNNPMNWRAAPTEEQVKSLPPTTPSRPSLLIAPTPAETMAVQRSKA